jgi:hypothetical protein
MAAEDFNGGGKLAVVATAAQSATSSMVRGGSPGGMETSSQQTVLPTSTALARAIVDMNILTLVQNSSYLTGLNAQLLAGVPRNARNELDMAGKLPLMLKANAIGIPPHELKIDPAQAGGLLSKFDATISRSGGAPGAAGVGGVEIKGSRSRRGHKKTFQLSRLLPGMRFEHLLLVMRSGNPTDWTDLLQLDDLFWLGHVLRPAFDRTVADRFGRSAPDEVKANTTIDSRRESWLGQPHPVGLVQKRHTELVEHQPARCAVRVAAQTRTFTQEAPVVQQLCCVTGPRGCAQYAVTLSCLWVVMVWSHLVVRLRT